MKEIKGFNGEYAFLSNFYENPLCVEIAVWNKPHKVVTMESFVFPTSEHAYHAFKVFRDWLHPQIEEIPEFEKFKLYETPGKAKRAGRKVPLDTEYWDKVKDNVMKYILIEKFRKAPLRNMLLATGDAYLEETNTWHDTYWGVCEGEGKNKLGRLLMEVREEGCKQFFTATRIGE